MVKYNLGELVLGSTQDAVEAMETLRTAIGYGWIGRFNPSPELLELLPDEDGEVEKKPERDFMLAGTLTLFDPAYIIPAFENIQKGCQKKNGNWVFRESDAICNAYDRQWEKIEAELANITPRVTGSMVRRK